MRTIRILMCAMLGYCTLASTAYGLEHPSALNAAQFGDYWRIESESPDYRVTFHGDTAEIVAPKGLTLWRAERMDGRVNIEYDACVVVEGDGDRLSDLNCFWMATDPERPDDIMARADWRRGVFARCYTLRQYYVGYGGNSNSTTRFRRYDGNAAAVDDATARPAILTEYTDQAHLLKPNHWYHIRLCNEGNRVCMYVDGERIVDFRDSDPLTGGWFGFRTTWSRTRITNFAYDCQPLYPQSVPLQWIGTPGNGGASTTFGVPYPPGQLTAAQPLVINTGDCRQIATDTWPLAYWPDGSVKWTAVAATIPADARGLTLGHGQAQCDAPVRVVQTPERIVVSTPTTVTYIPRDGTCIIDSIVHNGVKVAQSGRLVCSTQSHPTAEGVRQLTFADYQSRIDTVLVERAGDVRAVIRIDGRHSGEDGRQWLPFTVRLYFYGSSAQVRMVHTIVYDGDQDSDYVRSLGVRMDVPLRDELYNRHVAFGCGEGGVWSEPVQPASGRRVLTIGDDHTSALQHSQMQGQRLPAYEQYDRRNQRLLDDWAAWDCYRLSQLTPDGYTVRKRANADNPWIGTHSGHRADGYAFVGDMTGGLGMGMYDFWQSCPSGLEVSGAKGELATMTAWLWSPDAEAMDLRHYDNVAHGLESSYEDVQEGMSTPYGVARTTTLVLSPESGYAGKEAIATQAGAMDLEPILLPTPQYLHDVRAFGVWSLPDRSTPERARVEDRIDAYIEFYRAAIDQNRWYGFWNYGDVMHAYDPERHQWKYDVGGFAWDNTELASNMMLWYDFLRTGSPDYWRMAVAMTRHTGEVDVYHLGPYASLGSRHNVSHWGCGAKEARISQAAWNRFYHYLAADERCGDLMTEVVDADQLLYELDPMRLAQPRDMYPCTAPARLRIGPDWMAYAGNWMTQWERTGDTRYRDKIVAGMKSISALPSRMFTGPLALGYDPATGVLTTECDPALQSTNHLATIMGGFEIMNEMIEMIDLPEWRETWLDHNRNYKQKAWEIRNSRFRISRLMGYAAYHDHNAAMAAEAWDDLWGRHPEGRPELTELRAPEVPAPLLEWPWLSTNDAAQWTLDAIYMQEVIPQ